MIEAGDRLPPWSLPRHCRGTRGRSALYNLWWLDRLRATRRAEMNRAAHASGAAQRTRLAAAIAAVSLFVLAPPTPAAARQSGAAPADTARVHLLDALVVTADRASTPVSLSTGSVSLLTARQLRARPVATLAHALQQAPGLAFVDFDGLGRDPQLMVRGFYGGGEAEYALLLLNGRPLLDLETGRVPWDRIPLAAIESIEIVRGGSSAAWGDAALGAVINVITRRTGDASWRGSLTGGEHGLMRAAGAGLDSWRGHPISVFADVSRSDGFRTHAERRTGAFGATFGVVESPSRSLALFTTHDWRSVAEPGPLGGPELAQSRTVSSPFYRFDEADERRHELGIEGRITRPGGSHLSGSLTGELRSSDRIRTLVLTPEFADTKSRALDTERVAGSTTLQLYDLPLPGEDHLLLGIDASAGRARSTYFPFLQGTADVYAGADPVRGDAEQRGRGARAAVAGFVHYALQASEALRLTVGARYDRLHDSFDARPPSEELERETTHEAFSPKGGVNVRYLDTGSHQAYVYATISRSFKAPTLDQLFDQRPVPVPFPPFAISFANVDLEPQVGTNYEAGVYHRAELIPARLAAEVTLAAYQMDLRDEIDFDIQNLSYRNIGRSRHRGLEVGLRVDGPAALETFANYTLQAVTARAGDNDGKYLKAIPRHFVTAGVSAATASGVAGSLVATSARRMYLDDANTRTLPDWTRWDARLSYIWRGVRLSVDAFNLLDARFSTTGFPDPAGSDLVYYHPAAGRTLQFGVSRDW